MPFGHGVNGTSQGTLLPCPVASLAPMAVYTMVDPAAGGGVAVVGAVMALQPANNVATSRATTTCRPIREIGEAGLTLKNVQRECRMKSMALTRMTWFRGNGAVSVLKRLFARDATLRPGDPAPDFTLPGSDGRTYHLRDIVQQGHGVVLAWFPKAFTGG